jgi:hypothetical protein
MSSFNKLAKRYGFYRFRQRNSGGKFLRNMPYLFFVEANSPYHAERRAESLGLYFNEYREQNHDCDCCGPRWIETGIRTKIYDQINEIKNQTLISINIDRFNDGLIWIYLLNGDIIKFNNLEEMD